MLEDYNCLFSQSSLIKGGFEVLIPHLENSIKLAHTKTHSLKYDSYPKTILCGLLFIKVKLPNLVY